MMAPTPSTNGGQRTRRAGRVTIVVPAKDEENAIGEMLASLPVETLRMAGFETEVVVLDGHSLDHTRRIALYHGATVVSDSEEGKGSAVRKARHHFRGDYVVMLDGDGTYAPDAILRLLDPLAWGEADVVMGDRSPTQGAMTTTHRAGNALLSLAATMLYGRRCPDLCTGLWAFRGETLRSLPLRSQGFELEAELFALTARLNLRVAHVPVDYLPRTGEAKLSSLRDGARIAMCLVRSRFAPMAPMYFIVDAAGTTGKAVS